MSDAIRALCDEVIRLEAAPARTLTAAEDRDGALAYAAPVLAREVMRLRKELREVAEDRQVQARRESAMMTALPNRRFAGGTRVDEMVIQVCAWLRELRPELWTQP